MKKLLLVPLLITLALSACTRKPESESTAINVQARTAELARGGDLEVVKLDDPRRTCTVYTGVGISCVLDPVQSDK